MRIRLSKKVAIRKLFPLFSVLEKGDALYLPTRDNVHISTERRTIGLAVESTKGQPFAVYTRGIEGAPGVDHHTLFFAKDEYLC
ncbi:hypothetical protein F5144DRAFT_577884 [Chaetomium tenue]|uniref:Uncharacterized protein n=1 Tax=Chaetomium tenue TaxID=1854479 RepID=A0ACB7P4B3_9PEZI|nr:hypothetical protein F5144DRAFT_577884 [Chaetomium globosum]